jgi:hypothetical protein
MHCCTGGAITRGVFTHTPRIPRLRSNTDSSDKPPSTAPNGKATDIDNTFDVKR